AVLVLNERDARRAVGIVLDGHHRTPDAVLAPLEVDDAIHALVAAGAEARADDALIVPAASLLVALEQRLFRLLLAVGDFREIADRTAAPAWRHWLVFANAHDSPLFLSRPPLAAWLSRKRRISEELDRRAVRVQRDDGL